MTTRCTPYDIALMCANWTRPSHFHPNPAADGRDYREHYEAGMAASIAAWMAEGFFAWQFENRRQHAFAPVNHLIGTHVEDATYLDSLIVLRTELDLIEDPGYVPPRTDPEPEPVYLGRAFASGAAVAFVSLASAQKDYLFSPEKYVRAVCELLGLIQALVPNGAASRLYQGWRLLSEQHQRDPWLDTGHMELISHYVGLACYPLAHAGTRAEVLGHLVDMLAEPARNGSSRWQKDYGGLLNMVMGDGSHNRSWNDPAITPRQAPPAPQSWAAPWRSAAPAGRLQ